MTYPEPSFPILRFNLLLVRHPVPVPAPKCRGVVDANGVDAFDLEPGSFELIHEPAQRG